MLQGLNAVRLRIQAQTVALLAHAQAQQEEIVTLRAQIQRLEAEEARQRELKAEKEQQEADAKKKQEEAEAKKKQREAKAQQEQSRPVTSPGVRGRPSTSADHTSSTLGQGAELNPRPGTAPELITPTTQENKNKLKG